MFTADPEKSASSQITQQIFVEQQLCGRHYSPSLGYIREQNIGIYILDEEDRQQTIFTINNKDIYHMCIFHVQIQI